MELYGVLVLTGSALAMIAFLIDDLTSAQRFPPAASGGDTGSMRIPAVANSPGRPSIATDEDSFEEAA
jgi:hypothetical protein